MSTAAKALRVLVVGESWIKHTVHLKGFDQFHTTEYEEGAQVFLECLANRGFQVDYVRAHEISYRFPKEREELGVYDVVVVSDVGSNSFLLTDDTFLRSARTTNRLALLADFVREGGGLVMAGGYMSFAGIDGRARFGSSPLAEVLPVHMLDHDDRVEAPEGVSARVDAPEHDIVCEIDGEWPALLGYNRLVAKSDSCVVASINGDPLLVVGRAGAGFAVAFASDVAPHWAPREFLDWRHYGRLWGEIVEWAASGKIASVSAGSG